MRGEGLEPSRLAALVPQTSVSTNFTTLAYSTSNRNHILMSITNPIFAKELEVESLREMFG